MMAHRRVGRAWIHVLAVLAAGSYGGAIVGGCASSGGLPSWVKNPYGEFPKDKYVVAVGSGRNLDAAKRDALNGIATFLGVEITATVGVEQRETVTGENGQRSSSNRTRADESVNQIISQRLSSVVIERAHSEGPTTYVLALLDKPTFLAGLASEAENAARMLSEGIKTSAGANPPPRSMLLNLLATAQRLEALDAHIIALGGTINPEIAVTLRNSLGFLGRFDVSLPAPSRPTRPAPACDEGDPRFKKAIADAEALLGHSLEIRLNLEQLPKGRNFCDDLFESHIGLLPKDIARLKQYGAAPFAYSAPALKIIDLDYDGTLSRSEVEFHRDKGQLRIVMAGRGGYPIPSDAVSSVFGNEYRAWIIAHFSRVEPERVAAAEYALYFAFLTNLAAWGWDVPAAERAKRDELVEDPPYEVIVKMVRFTALAARKDAKIAAAARDWLAQHYADFGKAYLNSPELVAKAPAASAFKRAERAWIDWMNAAFGGFSDEMKWKILPDILEFSVPVHNDEGIVGSEIAYPGLQTYEMGLAIIDRWVKAGHPKAGAHGVGDDKQLALFLAIASPVKRQRPDHWTVEVFARRKNWYFHAIRTEALRKRLLAEILARKDDTFTETAFANILSVSDIADSRNGQRNEWADFLFFWRGLEVNQHQWKIATRLIAEGGGRTSGALYDESVKLWRRYPWARSYLLYLLARGNRDLVPWTEFGRVFGAPVSAKEASELLDLGWCAVDALSEAWPALGKGWSRSDILVSHLDRFIENPERCTNNTRGLVPTLRELIEKLRNDKASDDLSRLHTYFKKRIVLHPSEERDFQTLLDLTH